MKSKKSLYIIIGVVIIVILIAVLLLNSNWGKPPEVSYDVFYEDLVAGNVQGIIMTGNYTARVLSVNSEYNNAEKKTNFSLDDFKKDAKNSSYTLIIDYRLDLADDLQKSYEERLAAAQAADLTNGTNTAAAVSMPYFSLNDPNSGTSLSTIISIVSLVLLGVLVVVFVFSMRGGGKSGNSALNFGKTKARISANVKVRFTDVAGAEEEKEELKEIVEFLKSPKKFTAVGAKIPRGVLLVGSPGTGKTLFAKAVAGEANVPFFSISGSDFVEMFVGVGASRVRDLFAQAKKNMPCIVFIDEIDAVGRQRGAGLGGGNDEREQTLNQLLVQMDGFDTNDGIIIMAATNRVDILDPALLRPGRFDRQIYVHMPDVKGREAIFKVHARNKPIAPDIDFRNLARLTSGFSGADIANLLNEAAILAARDSRSVILMGDILEGINKVIAGPQKKSRITTASDKRITAYHEAGHAIVGRLMKYCDAVQEVSIIPRGLAAGYTISRPKNDDSHVTKNRLNDEIAMMLGGRAAEEIIIQDISTGASSDIKRATGIAHSMVCEWGMSDALPNLFFGGDQEVFIGRDYKTQQSYSEQIAGVIDEEVKKIIEANYARALDVLKNNIDVLDNMVKLLFDKETIYSDEVDMLMEGKSLEEINAYIEKKQKEQDEYSRKKSVSPVESLIVPEPKAEVPSEEAPYEAPNEETEKPDTEEKPNEEKPNEEKPDTEEKPDDGNHDGE